MKENKLKIAALVTGGYHTAGVEQRLQKKGISYLVVSPQMTELPKENLYEKIMRSYEKYFGVTEGTRGGTVKELSSLLSHKEHEPLFKELIERIVPELANELVKAWPANHA